MILYCRLFSVIAFLIACFWNVPSAMAGRAFDDFSVGVNGEGQVCRGQWQFGDSAIPTVVEIYCGGWERPSGRLTIRRAGSGPAGGSDLRDCPAVESDVKTDGDVSISQIRCKRRGEVGAQKLALVVRSKSGTVQGLLYPSDIAAGIRTARVMLALERPVPLKSDPNARANTLQCPDIRPGQTSLGLCAQASYLTLRQKAFSENAHWSFNSAERDFSDLLSLHRQIAPEDYADEAEILSEVAINLSAVGRNSEAADFSARALALAEELKSDLLIKKIRIYQAMDALHRQEWAKALEISRAIYRATNSAKKADSPHLASDSEPVSRLDDKQSKAILIASATAGPQKLLVNEGGLRNTDKIAVLNAQLAYVSAVALGRLGRNDDAELALADARAQLDKTEVGPSWLTASILAEQCQLEMAKRNYPAARQLLQRALLDLKQSAPQTRLEADLLLTQADLEGIAGQDAAALTTGRNAVRILSTQPESPGFSADIAAHQFDRLLKAWETGHDAQIANEYFEDLSLVWDGAAAHSAVQLAARLADRAGGDAVRAYQNAERQFRAASARRERLAADPTTSEEALAAASRVRDDAQRILEEKEASVRAQSPRYLELLHPKSDGEALSRSLGDHEGYLRLVSAESGLYAALVTHGAIYPFKVKLKKAEVIALVARVRASTRRIRSRIPDFDVIAAQRLYTEIFGPIADQMTHISLIHIDSGDVLTSLPFAALLTEAPDATVARNIRDAQNYVGAPWLARKVAIDTALGPAAFIRTRASRAKTDTGGPVIAFGGFHADPKGVAKRLMSLRNIKSNNELGHFSCESEIEKVLFGLQELPETADEAQADAGIFGANGKSIVGDAFTDTAVLENPDVGRASVLVFATHGVLGLSDCFSEPALLTSLGRQGEGILSASRVLDRDLSARLVIMSACDTAGGGRTDVSITGLTDGGEALSGLARSFLYAGANTVLATQWKLASSSSGRQTQSMLSELRHGKGLAAALSKTQADLFGSPDTSHPYFWATFILIGDGASELPASLRASGQ